MAVGGARPGSGRPHIPAEVKLARGTFSASRERAYLARVGGVLVAAEVPDPVEPRDYAAVMAGYLAAVAAGQVETQAGGPRGPACRWVVLACARQERDRARAEADPFWPYVWDQAAADRACHFVECCPHVEGRWETATIRLEPWQVFLVSALFGWRYRRDPRRRRFTTFYLEVARKAAKSTLIAALAYYHLCEEGELGASVICGATTGQQARMVFGIMGKMGRRSAWLRARGVEVYSNSIVVGDGSARPVNSKASSLDGLNPSCIVLDESHAQDFGLHDVLKSSQGARVNPLLLCPTTAGYDLLSVGYALRGQTAKVLEQVFQADHLFGIIYTLDEGDDWRDPAVWGKANPMLGVSPQVDYVERYCADAQQAPGLEGEFKVKICCLWAQAAAAWLSLTAWDACAEPTLKLEDFEGQPCWVGCDLAQVDDLAAVAYVFRRGPELVGFVRCYLPEDVVEERARVVPAYREWAAAGLLVKTEGSMTDYARIQADLEAAALRFQAAEIVFDQFGSAQMAGALAAKGLPAVVEPKNARTFTPPARELEARVRHRLFRHDGNSLFRWAASNVVVRRGVDDSILPKKESAESANKIDPVDALLSAIGAFLRGQAPPDGREYQMIVIGPGGRR